MARGSSRCARGSYSTNCWISACIHHRIGLSAYGACVSPTTSSVFTGLRWPPFPRPTELDCRIPFRIEVSDELHIGILMEIGVGMELSRRQVVEFLGSGSKAEGQAANRRIERTVRGCNAATIGWVYRWYAGRLAQNKCEIKDELFLIGEAEKKCRRGAGSNAFRVLQGKKSLVSQA